MRLFHQFEFRSQLSCPSVYIHLIAYFYWFQCEIFKKKSWQDMSSNMPFCKLNYCNNLLLQNAVAFYFTHWYFIRTANSYMCTYKSVIDIFERDTLMGFIEILWMQYSLLSLHIVKLIFSTVQLSNKMLYTFLNNLQSTSFHSVQCIKWIVRLKSGLNWIKKRQYWFYSNK